MSTGRLETFADGVFAIAATLLVLNVDAAVGERTESLGRDLVDAWPAYVGYVVSFVTIGIIWVNHHTVLSLVERADRPFLFANVVFLMCVAFIPFPTRLIAERLGAPGERAAALAYGITLTATAIMFSVVWFSASIGRRLLRDDADPQVVSGITRSYLPGPWIYLAATLVAIVSPAVGAILYGAIALFYVIESSFFGKTGTRKASAG
ncbi:MAG: TMEM175 family protein [Actinomycetota bacterium]